MPRNTPQYFDDDERQRKPTSDTNWVAFAKRLAEVYSRDDIFLLSPSEAEEVNDPDSAIRILSKVPKMSKELREKFCDAFLGEDMEYLTSATPIILANAYAAIRRRAENGEEGQQERLAQLAERIDTLSADFANSEGMVIDQGSWPIVDTTNIADVYEGFAEMLNARKADIDATQEPDKMQQFNDNLAHLEDVIAKYDETWGINKMHQGDGERLSERWDEVYGALNRADISDKTKEKLAKGKFLDSNGNVIPQFESGQEGDTNKYADYQPGYKIVRDGRLASVVELARHDLAKKHVADEGDVDEGTLEAELNDEVLYKMFEISTADQIVQGATEHPEQFTDPRYRDEFIQKLSDPEHTYEISDGGYNAAINAQTNATAGWAARVKKKIGAAGNFFSKIFKPIERIDRLAGVRMQRGAVNKRKKRVEFLVRILKGFASAFIASALITTIATAAAAVAGMSVAMAAATIGIITAIGMGVVQVMRWKKAQQAAGLPTDFKAFLKDKRLLMSLGTSVVAVVAMCFGAAGLAQAAKVIGFGALIMGGSNNALSAYRDARDANMSAGESIAWAIANAAAVIGGGFAGRAAAHAGINAYNEHHPDSGRFRHEVPGTEPSKDYEWQDQSETRLEYTQDALDNAKRIAHMWYRDNPEILQQRVDAINAYNLEHGTNIDPYRAIVLNGDAGGQTFDNMRLHVNNSHIDPNINDVYSHGHHRVLTDAWGRAYGFTHDELHAAGHLFGPDGSINPEGMDVIQRLDPMVGAKNTVGFVTGRPVQTDGYFKPNDPAGWTTYTNGDAPMTERLYEWKELVPVTKDPVPKLEPVYNGAVAAFGNYSLRERANDLRDRIGSFLDRVRRNRRPDPKPDPEPTPDPIPEPVPVEDDQRLLPPGTQIPDRKRLPAGDKGRQLPEPEVRPQLEDYKGGFLPVHVPRENISPDKVFGKPVLRDPDGTLQRVREEYRQRYNSKQLPPARPKQLPRGRVEPPFEDVRFAMTYQEAKKWDDLTRNLDRVRGKRHNPSLKKSEADKLWTQEKDIKEDLQQLFNRLGHPSPDDLREALADAYRREYKRMIQEKPEQVLAWERDQHARKNLGAQQYSDKEMPEAVRQWYKKRDYLLDKFEIYGWAEPLPEESLYFSAPTPGELEQEQSETMETISNEESKKKSYNTGTDSVLDRVKQLLEEKRKKGRRLLLGPGKGSSRRG